MTNLFPDTSHAAQQVLIELLRPLPAWRKLRMVADMNATVRVLALVGLRERFPEAGPAELHRRLADLLLGEELAAKADGPLDAS